MSAYVNIRQQEYIRTLHAMEEHTLVHHSEKNAIEKARVRDRVPDS
jgi:hypothetical protein